MSFLKQPFGSILQQVLLSVLVLGGVLIAQPWVRDLYRVGLLLVVGAALLEIGAGNIPPRAGWKKSVTLLVIALVIVGAVFSLGILLVPFLVALGR